MRVHTVVAVAMLAASLLTGADVPSSVSARSTFAAPVAFDVVAWRKQPAQVAAAYAATAHPARIHEESADPDAPAIVLLSALRFPLPSGGTAVVRIQAVPHAPVSMFSEDKGTFANGLVYQTLVAGPDGRLDITVHAGPGVIAETRFHVASPVTTGRLMVVAEVP